MSTDPIARLITAFGQVLARHRRERKMSCHALANVAGLSKESDIIIGLECGDFGPTLTDFFRIAWALGEDPMLLFIDLVAALRADPTDLGLYKSRASDFERIYRLGYHHKPGDFREQDRTYGSDAEATHAASILNQQRHQRRVALLDTICVYVRMSYIHIAKKPTP